ISPSRAIPKPSGFWVQGCVGDKSCESALSDVGLALQQLEEWCFSNRIIIFNKDDKTIVERDKVLGAANAKKVELAEPLEYLKDARENLQKLRA
ncbi:unnamed protein product, partial [Polarella glacialis]